MKRIETVLRQISLLCALITAGIAGAAMAGWIIGKIIIASMNISYIPMSLSTAMSFIMLSAAVFIYVRWSENPFCRKLAAVLTAFALLVCSIILVGFLIDVRFEAEHLFFRHPPEVSGFPVGHMSIVTAVNFLLSGISFLFLIHLPSDTKTSKNRATFPAVAVVCIGAVVSLGYLYGVPILYGGRLIPVALTTAISFLFLGTAIIAAAGPYSQPLSSFIGISVRSRLMRALFPSVIASILLFGWINSKIPLRGNPLLTTSLILIVLMIIMGVIIAKASKTIGGEIDISIAERKKSEEAVRQSHERLRRFVDANIVGIAIASPSGSIIDANDYYLSLIGYTREEFEQGKVDWRAITPPELLSVDEHAIEELRERGVCTPYEKEYVRRDGTRVSVFLSDAMLPGPEEQIAAFVLDITERKRIEAALRENEARLKIALSQVNMAVFDQDLDLYYTWMYQPQLGYTTEQVVGKTDADLLPPEAARQATEIKRRVLEKGTGARGEVEVVLEDRTIYYALIVEPLHNAAGQVVGIVGASLDITERKTAEEKLVTYQKHLEELIDERTGELQDAQKSLMNFVDDLEQNRNELAQANERLKELDRLKSIFIASMSHELRTPLNSIIGFSSILHDEWLGPLNAEQKLNLFAILKAGRHLLELINDIIDLPKIEAGIIEIHSENFDLDGVITDAVDLLKKEAGEKGLELKVESVHHGMHTDRRRFLQCVVNLMSNAVKFTEKGFVKIEVKKMRSYEDEKKKEEADYIEIIVKDTGIGIKEEDIPKLFQPFVRLHTMSNIPGTGLGLYLTKKILTEILKGVIMVSSEYGKGSKFVIRIPVKT